MKTVVIDIETTGIPAKGYVYDKDFMAYPYIVTMAFKINDEPTEYFIINQEGRPIPPEATAIHGITDEMAANSPHKLGAILSILLVKANAADAVIGHNIYFDTSIIKANTLRLVFNNSQRKCLNECDQAMAEDFYQDLEELLHKDRRVDTMMKTIKFCDLGGKWPKLSELYAILFPGETFNAHNAKDDVDATYKCYVRLKELGVI